MQFSAPEDDNSRQQAFVPFSGVLFEMLRRAMTQSQRVRFVLTLFARQPNLATAKTSCFVLVRTFFVSFGPLRRSFEGVVLLGG